MKCDICKKENCKDKVHKYVVRHNLYYDKDGELKISKSGIDKLNNNERNK